MKKLLIASAALAIISVPAQAQLLGGSGGLGGMAGGAFGGSGSIGGIGNVGGMGPDFSGTTNSIRNGTRSTIDGAADSSGGQSVDRRSGSVAANRSANANGSGSLSQLVQNPVAPISGEASGSGNASGQGNANAQLVGTDSLGAIAGSGASQARGAAATGQSLVGNAAGQAAGSANGAAGSAAALDSITGSGAGSATGSGPSSGDTGAGLAGPMLATAGSAAAAGQGAFAVTPGMNVLTPSGQQIGQVRQIVANSRGQITQLMVSDGTEEVLVPAESFSASGNALVAGSSTGSASAANEAE